MTLAATARPGRRLLDAGEATVELFQQRDDLVGLYDQTWVFRVEESPGVLIVGVWGGAWVGTGVIVTVDEQPTTVGIVIAVGTPPDAGTYVALATLGAVRVVLSSPVGDRTVIDRNA